MNPRGDGTSDPKNRLQSKILESSSDVAKVASQTSAEFNVS
jgi:hypothetical protein